MQAVLFRIGVVIHYISFLIVLFYVGAIFYANLSLLALAATILFVIWRLF